MRFVALVLAAIAATVLAACAGSEKPIEALGDPCGPVIYDGEGRPDMLIVSSFPLRGVSRLATGPMVGAITQVLRQHGFRAGEHRVGYQSCDESVGNDVDAVRCEQNARAFVANRSVRGVVGTYYSGCAVIMLPILSRQSAGPLGMVSPSNTYLGLTRDGPGTEGYGPARLYPDGIRNYVRVVAPDDAQGAAAALVARDRGARRVVALMLPRDAYSLGNGNSFLRAARKLGLAASRVTWRPSRSPAELAARVAGLRPDAVYLAGPPIKGRRLVEDLRAALRRGTLLVAPDAWTPVAGELGPAGEGMLVTAAGVPWPYLTDRGRRLLGSVPGAREAGQESYAPEAAQATEVLLDAIRRSDGSRRSVVAELFLTRVRGGILGDFRFDRAGDIDPSSHELYRFANGRERVVGVVRAPSELVRDEP